MSQMHKTWFVAGLLALGAVFQSFGATAITSAENILFLNGKASLEKAGKTVYNASFKKGSPLGRPTMNYLKKTAFKLEKFKGRDALVVRAAKDKSSAWGVRVAPFAVQANKHFIIEMDVCGTVSMLKGAGRKSYSNYYFFLDKNNHVCNEGYFYYESLSDKWITVKSAGKIPSDAVKMVLQVGGSPSIAKGGFLAYSKIQVRTFDKKTPSKTNGFFISRPLPLAKGARLEAKITRSASSSLTFQIQTAPDVKGRPGVWSAWKRYDNKPIQSKDPWLRYKAQFGGSGRSVILHQVQLGSVTDKDFTAKKDTHAPIVKRLTPSPVQNPMAKVVFQVTDETGVNFKTLRCFLNKKEITNQLKRKGNILTYTPKQPLQKIQGSSASKGINKFSFQMEDLLGQKGKMNEYCYVGPAYKGNKVTFRDDGMMIINGKEFFPLGFFSGKPHEDQMKVWKAHGVNFLQSFDGGKVAADLVRLAEKYDLKVCIRWWLAAHRNSKAVVGYYTADDSRRFSDYTLKNTSNQVHSFAPGAFKAHSEMPFQSYTSFYMPKIWTCDVFMAQLYPISNKPTVIRCGAQRIITDVKTMVRDRKNSVNKNNCIIAGPQVYSDKNIWTRFPTKEEIKVMAYLAVIHGANGIAYYSYTASRKSKDEYGYKAALETLKELSTLTPALLSRKTVKLPAPAVIKGPAKDKDKNESINVLARMVGKDLYIFAANSAAQEVTVRFSAIKGKQAVLPFEKRSLPVRNGMMTDRFTGYGVHVYKVRMF